MADPSVLTKLDLNQYGLKKLASGKVREVFEADHDSLLFIATDRISAYDVILENVSHLFARSNDLGSGLILVITADVLFACQGVNAIPESITHDIMLSR